MSPRLSRRRTVIAVASAAAVIGATLFTGTATAATSAEPVSTAVPIVTPDGMLMSYILNTAKASNPGQVQVLSNAVRKAGGVVVQSWPEIGVVVAHSDRAAFRTNVAASAGAALESVGATRTVSVSEDTPDGMGAMWAPGASSYKKGAKKDYNGDLPTEETPATVRRPARGRAVGHADRSRPTRPTQITDGSRNVLVGVLDSGIDPDHPDLAANIDDADSVNCTDAGRPDLSPTGWFPTTSDHGTHVAGTIAAARNGVGIVGVAPNVRMASVKVVNDRRVHLPRVRRLRVRLGRHEAHGRHEQQLLRRPVHVLLRGPARPVRRQGGRAPRRRVVDRPGRRPRRAAGNAATDLSNNTMDTT